MLQVLKIRVILGALEMVDRQGVNCGVERLSRAKTRGLDRVPRQCAVTHALTDLLGIDWRRQIDVRVHAAVLCAFARYAVVLADCQRELTEPRIVFRLQILIERVQVLYGSLAERFLPDNDATGIVLYRGGENFGCRGAKAVDKNGQRTVVRDSCNRIRVVKAADTAVGVAQLNDRTVIDKQTRKRCRFGQMAAAIVAQVDDQTVDAFLLEFGDQAFDVFRGARVVLVAIAQCAVVAVKTRDFDNTD